MAQVSVTLGLAKTRLSSPVDFNLLLITIKLRKHTKKIYICVCMLAKIHTRRTYKMYTPYTFFCPRIFGIYFFSVRAHTHTHAHARARTHFRHHGIVRIASLGLKTRRSNENLIFENRGEINNFPFSENH